MDMKEKVLSGILRSLQIILALLAVIALGVMEGTPLPSNGNDRTNSGSSVPEYPTLQFGVVIAVLAVVWSFLALIPALQPSIRLVGDYLTTVLVACAGAACGALRQGAEDFGGQSGNPVCQYGSNSETNKNWCQPLAGGAALLMLCSVTYAPLHLKNLLSTPAKHQRMDDAGTAPGQSI